ncbi:MAG: hypothetical protein V1820_03195 [archaeon]
MDLIIFLITLVCLTALLKPFTFPGDSNFDDASSTALLFFALLAYFYGVDFFPSSSFLGFLHVLTIGLVNAMAIIDLFITTVLGVPLTLNLLFVIVVPAMIVFSIAKGIIKYVGFFTDRTSTFFALMLSFISIVAAVRGDFNLIQSAFRALIAFVEYVFGQTSLFTATTSLVVSCLFLVTIGVVFQSMTTFFVGAITSRSRQD